MAGTRGTWWTLCTLALWLAAVLIVMPFETKGNNQFDRAGVAQTVSSQQAGGNMEGVETRFGPASCGLFAASTTGTSTGAINCQHDSMTPIAGAVPLVNIMFGEVSPGGTGSGLYGMLIFALLAVFIAGLMVGRTPEYLGKKLVAREIKLLTLAVLFTPLAALMTSATAIATPAGRASLAATGPQGFSEGLYAYLSQANNNGSAWAGYTGYVQPRPGNLGAHGIAFADLLGGLTMVFARFAPILFVLALAGALAGKQVVPGGLGTMRTDTPTFVVLVIGVVLLLGALTFFPAILLGPVVQGLSTRLF